MSMSIIGPMTPAKLALALGTVGVGALVGGFVADQRDGDVGTGALIGGLSAAAGIAVLVGGASAWSHFSAARSGAAAGASHLAAPGTGLSRLAATEFAATGHALPVLATAAPSGVIEAAALAARPVTELPSAWSLFHATATPIASTAASLGRTPVLPAAATSFRSGGTFVDALRGFMH